MSKSTKKIETPVRSMVSKPVYDPTKPYQWDPAQVFPLTGIQLQQILRSLQDNLDSVQGKVILRQYESYKICQSLLEKGVGEGYVVEIVDTKPTA